MKYLPLILLFIVSCADPCENTVCYNGGVCIEGNCDCPDGYTGPDCSTQATPLVITIEKVTLTQWPAGSWDISTCPDIYFKLYRGGTLITTTGSVNDACSGAITYTGPVDVTQPAEQMNIKFYDADSPDPDDLMGDILFYLYTPAGGFPATLSYTAGSFTYNITVTYSW